MIKIIPLLLLALSTSAFADENKINWDGYYVSALLGRTAGNVDWNKGTSDWVMPVQATDYYLFPTATSSSSDGWSGSLRLGYNRAIEKNLIGVELGANFQDAGGNITPTSYQQTNATNIGTVSGFVTKITVQSYETLTVRLGRLLDEKTLAYISIGVAAGQFKNKTSQSNATGLIFGLPDGWWDAGVSSSDNKTELGYTLGIGAEHKFKDNWSIRANYELVNFGNINTTYRGSYGDATPAVYLKNSVYFNNLSVGLSYQF